MSHKLNYGNFLCHKVQGADVQAFVLKLLINTNYYLKLFLNLKSNYVKVILEINY